MSKHSISLKRDGINGFSSTQSVGTDALNAMLSIPGVRDPEIVVESSDKVELTYSWVGESEFLGTSAYLHKFGLTLVPESVTSSFPANISD